MPDNPILPACESADTGLHSQINPSARILVVEDDPFIRHLSAEVLIRQGYVVNAAADGAAAWKELQAINYNLLITDYELPKITGLGLVKKLRAARLALPVVMVADKLPAHALARNPSLQLAATLLKPFAIDALVDTVKNVLRATIDPCDLIAARANAITQVLQEILQRYHDRSPWGLIV